jgi:NAD+ synthetase
MKIALAQINPAIADTASNMKKIISFMNQADKHGAQITIFPELCTIGYPPMDLLESRRLVDDNIRSLKAIAEATSGLETAAVIGCVEHDAKNSPMLYNTATVIHRGKIIFRQHKTLIPGYDLFDEHRYFSHAEDSKIFEFRGKKIGITICEDIWPAFREDNSPFMERRRYDRDPVRLIAERGADLILNISASAYTRGRRQARMEALAKLAREKNIPIVFVNQVGANDSLIFDGNSMFINGKGEICAHARGFSEDLMVIETDSPVPCEVKINDIEDIRRALMLGISDYMAKSGFSKAVLGLSGGIDSALVAALACQAIGQDNVTGITMPSEYSSAGSVDDSYALARNLGMRIETISIKGLFDRFRNDLSGLFSGLKEDITEENIQARIRGTLLMSFSNKTGALLLTNGNKSEFAVGYCTLYGDMCGGLAVISDLPKTMVYELSEHINRSEGRELIPRAIIEKEPSAELRSGQKDQDSLPPYDILDGILELYIEQHKSAEEIISAGYDRQIVNNVLKLINNSEYKRYQAAPGLKVTSKAFGAGRRIPLAKKFTP